MNVRAKFQVQEIKHMHSGSGPMACMKMTAVYGDGKENKEWSKYTPQGELTITITNPPAIEAFKIGGEYFLDFSPVE